MVEEMKAAVEAAGEDFYPTRPLPAKSELREVGEDLTVQVKDWDPGDISARGQKSGHFPISCVSGENPGPVTGLAPRGISDCRFQIVDWRSRKREGASWPASKEQSAAPYASARPETLLTHSGRCGVGWQGQPAAPGLRPVGCEG
jgi:hypothetical protein